MQRPETGPKVTSVPPPSPNSFGNRPGLSRLDISVEGQSVQANSSNVFPTPPPSAGLSLHSKPGVNESYTPRGSNLLPLLPTHPPQQDVLPPAQSLSRRPGTQLHVVQSQYLPQPQAEGGMMMQERNMQPTEGSYSQSSHRQMPSMVHTRGQGHSLQTVQQLQATHFHAQHQRMGPNDAFANGSMPSVVQPRPQLVPYEPSQGRATDFSVQGTSPNFNSAPGSGGTSNAAASPNAPCPPSASTTTPRHETQARPSRSDVPQSGQNPTASGLWSPTMWGPAEHAKGTMDGIRVFVDKVLSDAERTLAEELARIKAQYQARESYAMRAFVMRIAEKDAAMAACARERDEARNALRQMDGEKRILKENFEKLYRDSVLFNEECTKMREERTALKEENLKLQEVVAKLALAQHERDKMGEEQRTGGEAFKAWITRLMTETKRESEKDLQVPKHLTVPQSMPNEITLESDLRPTQTSSEPVSVSPVPVLGTTITSQLPETDSHTSIRPGSRSRSSTIVTGLATPKTPHMAVLCERRDSIPPPASEVIDLTDDVECQPVAPSQPVEILPSITSNLGSDPDTGRKRQRSPSISGPSLSDHELALKRRRLEDALAIAIHMTRSVPSAERQRVTPPASASVASVMEPIDQADRDKTFVEDDPKDSPTVEDLTLQYDEEDGIEESKPPENQDRTVADASPNIDQLKEEEEEQVEKIVKQEVGDDAIRITLPATGHTSLPLSPKEENANEVIEEGEIFKDSDSNEDNDVLESGEATPELLPSTPQPLPRKQLSIRHLPLIYEEDKRSQSLKCRMCHFRRGFDPSYPLQTFPLNASWAELSGHCENEHPRAFERLVRMTEEDIAEAKMRK